MTTEGVVGDAMSTGGVVEVNMIPEGDGDMTTEGVAGDAISMEGVVEVKD
jgi:hypothetical protein